MSGPQQNVSRIKFFKFYSFLLSQYGPQIAALEKELSSVEQKPDQLYNECMFLDSIQTSQQSLLEQKVLEWK